MSSNEQNPGLIKEHANYAAGYVKETVGSVTGSEDWKSTGQADQQAAMDGMKSASQNRDPNQSGYGKVEEVAGKAVGCEGMEEEGAASKKE